MVVAPGSTNPSPPNVEGDRKLQVRRSHWRYSEEEPRTYNDMGLRSPQTQPVLKLYRIGKRMRKTFTIDDLDIKTPPASRIPSHSLQDNL